MKDLYDETQWVDEMDEGIHNETYNFCEIQTENFQADKPNS